MGTSHLRAVNKSIRARGLDKSPEHAPLVMLVRDIAREMDAAGPEGPSGRLQERYRGALRDLHGPAGKVKPVPVPGEEPKLNALEEFKRKHKVGPEYN